MSEMLETPNFGKTRGFWKEVRCVTQNFDAYAAGAIPIVFSNEYEFKIETAYNQKLHLDKSYFACTDVLAAGNAQNAPTVASTVSRTWNHVSSLFNQFQVDIQGTNVENIINVAETDSMVKRCKYNETFFNRIGECMNLKQYTNGILAVGGGVGSTTAIAQHDAEMVQKNLREFLGDATQTYVWHPDCSAIFDEVLTQNLSISVKLRVDPAHRVRAVQSTSAASIVNGNGANEYRYCVTNLVLYVYITEEDVAPTLPKVFDLRPVKAVRQTWNVGATAGTMNYTGIPGTTYQISLALNDINRNTSTIYSPTEFFTANDLQQLTSYRLKYASFDFPQYQITETEASKRFRSYIQSMSDFDKDDLVDTGESYIFYTCRGPIYNFSIVKRADDLSTDAELYLSAPANINADVYLFCRHTKELILEYDETGKCIRVSCEIVSKV